MIFVLHGEDCASSYERLSQILENYDNQEKDWLKIRLAKNTTLNQLTEAVIAQDLTGSPRIIIAEDFLSQLKNIPQSFLRAVPEDTVVIFWEKTTLSPTKISKLQKIAHLERFTLKTALFTFLDNIYPDSSPPLGLLASLKDTPGLAWHLQNRILLLLLSKLNIQRAQAIKITKRNIHDWQWDKIANQASKFDLATLLSTYSSSLKIDFLTKTGKTDVPASTLISMLLLKYLR